MDLKLKKRIFELTGNISSIQLSDKVILLTLFNSGTLRKPISNLTVKNLMEELDESEASIRYYLNRLKKLKLIKQVYIIQNGVETVKITNFKAVMKLGLKNINKSYYKLLGAK